MYQPTFPEDSILKRHFDSTVEMKRQKWLQLPPTDSILSRHAISKNEHSRSRTEATLSTPRTKASVASVTSHPSQTRAESRGFLARFFSLFRRSA
jgi:hypothetical protein